MWNARGDVGRCRGGNFPRPHKRPVSSLSPTPRWRRGSGDGAGHKLGFAADEANAACVCEDHGETYTSIEVNRPGWGDRDFDVRFYTEVGEYGMKISYDVSDQCYNVSAVDERDDGSSYAAFEFYARDDSSVDLEFGGADSVEAFFKTMYNDPEIEDVYLYSVLLMQPFINDTFDMSVDELYSLPVVG